MIVVERGPAAVSAPSDCKNWVATRQHVEDRLLIPDERMADGLLRAYGRWLIQGHKAHRFDLGDIRFIQLLTWWSGDWSAGQRDAYVRVLRWAWMVWFRTGS